MTPALTQELRRLLGPRFQSHGERPRVEPASDRELNRLLQLLAEHGASLAELVLSRARFDLFGALDAKSAVVEVGAGLRLIEIEDRVSAAGFSLGPLSPGILQLTVAEFLEGPWAGARAVRGGRLEAVPLALTALLADGSLYRSLPSPRSAAGPDLDGLFLAGGARAGLVLGATLRLYPRPEVARELLVTAPALPSLRRAMKAALLAGAWVARIRLWLQDDRPYAQVRFVGTAKSVARDLRTLSLCVQAEGGTPLTALRDEPLTGARVERECSWEDVQLASGSLLRLHRVSVDSVVLEGPPVSELPASSLDEGSKDFFSRIEPTGLFGGR